MTHTEIIAVVLAWMAEDVPLDEGTDETIAEIAELDEDTHGPWQPWWDVEIGRRVWCQARADAPPWVENHVYRTIVLGTHVETIEDGDPFPPALLKHLNRLIPKGQA